MGLRAKKRSLDPSRTALLRRLFWADMQRRFKQLSKDILSLFATENLFPTQQQPLSLNLDAGEFQFATNPQKIKMFRKWLQDKVDEGVLEVVGGTKGKPWTAKYVESAYRKGILRAYSDTNKKSKLKDIAYFGGAKEQFLKMALASPVLMSQLELLATRSFNLLKGVSDQMSDRMSLILAEGLAHGYSPQKIAREMTKAVSSLSKKRALMIARTEIINAHAEGQLDSFALLGVSEVRAEVEFSTSKDEKVCSACATLEGKRYTIDAARGVIPVHPSCRCAWSSVIDRSLLKGV